MNPKDDRIFNTNPHPKGKKHQVRRMCAALGFQVKALKRNPGSRPQSQKLKPGAFYELKPKEFSKTSRDIRAQYSHLQILLHVYSRACES